MYICVWFDGDLNHSKSWLNHGKRLSPMLRTKLFSKNIDARLVFVAVGDQGPWWWFGVLPSSIDPVEHLGSPGAWFQNGAPLHQVQFDARDASTAGLNPELRATFCRLEFSDEWPRGQIGTHGAGFENASEIMFDIRTSRPNAVHFDPFNYR